MKPFLAAGEVLINPSLLAFAVVETDSEGPAVRLVFAGSAGDSPLELALSGLEARSVIRWLRSHAEFLDAGTPSFRRGHAAAVHREPAPQVAVRLGS